MPNEVDSFQKGRDYTESLIIDEEDQNNATRPKFIEFIQENSQSDDPSEPVDDLDFSRAGWQLSIKKSKQT